MAENVDGVVSAVENMWSTVAVGAKGSLQFSLTEIHMPESLEGVDRPRPLASRPDVAAYLGVPTSTLDRWARLRTGPPYVRVGRHARYRWADVESWLERDGATGSSA